MDSGKVSESVLKRSVLKYVQQNNQSVENACHLIQEAKIGADSSLFAISENLAAKGSKVGMTAENPVLGSAVAVSAGRYPEVAVEAVINACNNLICSGAEAFGVQIALVLPEALYESELRHIMEAVKVYTAKHQICILGGHTTVSKYVTETVATVAAIGYVKDRQITSRGADAGGKQTSDKESQLRPGLSVVMSKWIGLQGTARLVREQKEALLKRLPPRFLGGAAEYGAYMSIVPEACIAWQAGAAALHDISGGGIFRALWELAELSGTGIRIDMKKIPVKQETIEVCEVFGLNPYELLSGGALLMLTADGEGLVEKLAAAGISSAVIGTLTDNNDRVLVTLGEDGEELRFLERPRTDEIDKI